jgi:hypothetical protein
MKTVVLVPDFGPVTVTVVESVFVIRVGCVTVVTLVVVTDENVATEATEAVVDVVVVAEEKTVVVRLLVTIA